MRAGLTFAVAAAGTALVLGLAQLAAGPGTLRASSPGAAPARAAPVPPVPSGPPAPPPGASLLARLRGPAAVYARPGAARALHRLAGRTAAGSPRVLLVTRTRRDGWLRILLPLRPNGSAGWIRRRDTELEFDRWAVIVSLRARRLTVLRDGRPLWTTRVAIGARGTPTPTGRYFVTELLRQPDPGGLYGPWVFALSGFSRVLTAFHGGHGEIGLHGTDSPGRLGAAVSHGCVRMANRAIVRLARELPLGTSVRIRR